MINTNLLPVIICYFFFGLIFNFLFVKFAHKEILKWTDSEIANSCSLIAIKWLLLNFLFVSCFGYAHFKALHLPLNETLYPKELFRGLIICSWLSLLIVLAKIDIQTNLLPDRLTLSLAIIGIVFSLLFEHISLIQSLGSAFLGFAFLKVSIYFFILFKKYVSKDITNSPGSAFGRGDICLITALGIWVGWETLLIIVLFSSLIMITIFTYGCFFYKWDLDKRLPFGPIICLMSILLGTPQFLRIY